jgi:hypothetical protein
VGIVALQARVNDEKPDIYQLFGRVHNFRAEKVDTEAKLYRHDPAKPGEEGELIDAISLQLPPQSDQSFKFDLPDTGLAELEVKLSVQDALEVDNRAFAIVGNARKAQILAITNGNRYLLDAFNTPIASERALVRVATPEEAKGEELAREVRGGRYDLVIYDGVSPETPPEANALYFGALPPGPAYAKSKSIEQPVILDWNISHPLMQYIRDLSLVFVAKANVVELPPGATSLIESNQGPLAFVIAREGFTDTVVMFPLLDGATPNTTWFRYISFPLFLLNGVQAMGNIREGTGEGYAAPSRPVILRPETSGKDIRVTSADGRSVEDLKRSPQGTFVYTQGNTTGLYHARWAPDGILPFAVNLFDFRESDLAPRGLVPVGVPDSQAESYKIKIGASPVAGTQRPKDVSHDWWKYLAGAVLVVLLIEWYIYNKRVYI